MFCKNCGEQLEKDAQFCIRCGMKVSSAPPAQPQAASVPSGETACPASPQAPRLKTGPKGKYMLFGAGGTAAGAILLAVILLIAGVFSSGVRTIEGPGFATPEDAAKAYLIALKNQDVDAMVSTFAVESYADNYDLEAMVERLKSYLPSYEIRLPGTNDYNRQLNIASRRNQLASVITNQYMYYNAAAELNGYDPTILMEEDEIQDFFNKFERDMKNYVFADLKVGDVLQPEDVSDLYMAIDNQQNIAKQAKVFGVSADDIANVAVEFSADGQKWLFCPQAIRYNGKWYLQSQMGNLAYLLGMNIYTGGISPLDKLGLS